MAMRITIIEKATGRMKTITEGGDFNRYEWAEGSRSCDCNRARLFGLDDHRCGEGLFAVRVVDEATDVALYDEIDGNDKQGDA